VVIAGANLSAMSALAGASGGDPVACQGLLAADEIPWLKQHPDIRIAPTPDYTPIEFFDGKGKYSGITADSFELIQDPQRERMGRYLAWGASGLAVLLVTVTFWNRLLAARVRAGTRELRDELSRRSQAEAALHASEERFAKAFRTSFESANEATFLMRQDRIIDCNIKMLTLLGATREQLLNSQLQDLSPPTQPDGASSEEKSKAHIERAFAGEPQLFEWVHRRCDGQFFEAEVSLNRLELVGETLLQGVIHDVSVRKRAEAALRQSEERFREMNATLERRVAERTEELAVAKERAESADRLKSAFLATMSHELRTPLNSIIGFTGIMLQGLAGPLNPEQTKQLGMVQGSARHLLALINDVLDISKIEAGQLDIHPEPFELGASLERVTATVRPLADKKGLLLRVVSPATPVGMVSDRVRVEQVLLNLLNNAVKFTPQGEVALQAELIHDYTLPGGQAPQPAVRLQVADTGIGIKEEDLAKLFQPFRQVDAGLARQHEGTGLGLAICRRLAEMLGGIIDVRSIWGIGTIFTFIIPLHRVNNHEARNPAH